MCILTSILVVFLSCASIKHNLFDDPHCSINQGPIFAATGYPYFGLHSPLPKTRVVLSLVDFATRFVEFSGWVPVRPCL